MYGYPYGSYAAPMTASLVRPMAASCKEKEYH